MKRLLSKTFVIASLALLIAGIGANPAGAAPSAAGGAALTGTTSADFTDIALATPNPVANNVSLSGPAVGVIGTTPATCTVTFQGSGSDTILAGGGSGSLTCVGTGVSVSCSSVIYARTGGHVTVTGNCSGSANGPLSANCSIQVVPTQRLITAQCEYTVDIL